MKKSILKLIIASELESINTKEFKFDLEVMAEEMSFFIKKQLKEAPFYVYFGFNLLHILFTLFLLLTFTNFRNKKNICKKIEIFSMANPFFANYQRVIISMTLLKYFEYDAVFKSLNYETVSTRVINNRKIRNDLLSSSSAHDSKS